MTEALTAEKLREELHYDPDTGLFTWLKHGWSTRVGMVAGGLSDRGYVVIVIGGKLRKAHRLAWLYMTGSWPEATVDHRNGLKSDNRWANLRDVSSAVNTQNERLPRRNNRSGLLGAWYDPKSDSWVSSIRSDGRRIFLGRFPTAHPAHAAYVAAKRERHEGCTL